jgi:hypothetical protein
MSALHGHENGTENDGNGDAAGAADMEEEVAI